MASIHAYLIRHAEVENPGRILYGHLEGFHLSGRGRSQAAALGRRLKASGIERIIHSPLMRAEQTALLIQEGMGRPVILESDPRLLEAEFSRYLQGVPYWQIPLRRPLWFVHRARRGLLPGDEPLDVLGGRVLEVLQEAVTARPEEVVALVSHADPLQAAWVLMEGRPRSEREMMRSAIDRAGMLEVSADLDGGRLVAREVRYQAPPADPAA